MMDNFGENMAILCLVIVVYYSLLNVNNTLLNINNTLKHLDKTIQYVKFVDVIGVNS